jgi:hypothetical protein
MRRTLTIAVVAAFFAGIATTAAATHLFPDVPDDSVHAEGIEWAVFRGIIEGRVDGTFGPNDPVTRGQLATMLQRNEEGTRPVHYLMSPICGETSMTVVDLGGRGSGAATVEYSVDGGDRVEITGIPDEGFLTFDPGVSGLITLYVDSLAWSTMPTAESCTAPS